MMLYPPMSELAAKAGSRYLLVNLVARRARNIAAAAQAAKLLHSDYGRAAVAAYVQNWLGENDIVCTSDIPLENDRDYVMHV